MSNLKVETNVPVKSNDRFGSVKKLKLDEWTFTFILFLFSISIIVGKLCLNYYDISCNEILDYFKNQINPYQDDFLYKAIVEPSRKYSWLIKATVSGLATTGITWFIIYEDSFVPGINPPSPFNSQRSNLGGGLELNYFVGSLNGLLVFLYLCL